MPCIESVTPIATESIDTMGMARTPITIIWAKRGSARTRWPFWRPMMSQ